MPSFACFSVDTNLPVNNSISQSNAEIKRKIIAEARPKAAESMGKAKKMKKTAQIIATARPKQAENG